MKDELLKILIYLKETNSWDLAEELAKGVYKQDKIKDSVLDSLLYFLNNLIRKSNFSNKQKNLIKARNMMIELRNKEKQEKIKEENELEQLLEF